MIFFRLDECVAYKIARAAEEIGIPQGIVFEAPQLNAQKGVADVAWMKEFATRGKPTDIKMVFSTDAAMEHTEAERVAATEAGLIVFYGPKAKFWRPLKRFGQAAYFLRWFLTMTEIARAAKPGDQFQLPSNFILRSSLTPLPPLSAKRNRPGRPRQVRPSGSLV